MKNGRRRPQERLRPTATCGLGRGGRSAPCGRRRWPSARGSHGGACERACSVDRSASRSCLQIRCAQKRAPGPRRAVSGRRAGLKTLRRFRAAGKRAYAVGARGSQSEVAPLEARSRGPFACWAYRFNHAAVEPPSSAGSERQTVGWPSIDCIRRASAGVARARFAQTRTPCGASSASSDLKTEISGAKPSKKARSYGADRDGRTSAKFPASTVIRLDKFASSILRRASSTWIGSRSIVSTRASGDPEARQQAV